MGAGSSCAKRPCANCNRKNPPWLAHRYETQVLLANDAIRESRIASRLAAIVLSYSRGLRPSTRGGQLRRSRFPLHRPNEEWDEYAVLGAGGWTALVWEPDRAPREIASQTMEGKVTRIGTTKRGQRISARTRDLNGKIARGAARERKRDRVQRDSRDRR